MYNGDTIISESAKQINGRVHLKHAEDFTKQKSCSLACATHQQPSNNL
jgi:hypothetical protein